MSGPDTAAQLNEPRQPVAGINSPCATGTERFEACDRWHPDTESRFSFQSNGEFKVRRCLECARNRVVVHRDTKKSRESYGVLPRLTWAPPQI